MCKEVFFMRRYRIGTRYRLIHKFGYQNWYQEGKNGFRTLLVNTHIQQPKKLGRHWAERKRTWEMNTAHTLQDSSIRSFNQHRVSDVSSQEALQQTEEAMRDTWLVSTRQKQYITNIMYIYIWLPSINSTTHCYLVPQRHTWTQIHPPEFK